MKLYFAIIDENANVTTSVSTGEPMDLLKQVFVSCPTGEFNLHSLKIAERVEEIDHIWNTVFDGMTEPHQVIDAISRHITAKDADQEIAEELAEALLIFNLTDGNHHLVDFLSDLRGIFGGIEYELSAYTESQTTLIVRIEM